jgi:hypothetical protein
MVFAGASTRRPVAVVVAWPQAAQNTLANTRRRYVARSWLQFDNWRRLVGFPRHRPQQRLAVLVEIVDFQYRYRWQAVAGPPLAAVAALDQSGVFEFA